MEYEALSCGAWLGIVWGTWDGRGCIEGRGGSEGVACVGPRDCEAGDGADSPGVCGVVAGESIIVPGFKLAP